MRLYEIINEDRIDEINAKKAVAAGALALATLNFSGKDASKPMQQPPPASKISDDISTLASAISQKYKINQNLAKEIVQSAKKHSDNVFPKTNDILAIIGIESSFNPNAVSGLKKDPAVGLTQIRPGVWNLDANKLKGNIDKQIASSVEILKQYNARLKNTEDAVHAYNVGITSFRKGNLNPNYVVKFNREKDFFDDVSKTNY